MRPRTLTALALLAGVAALAAPAETPPAPAKEKDRDKEKPGAGTEIELVEKLIDARRDYQYSLERLRNYYIRTNDPERTKWVEDELKQYHRMMKYSYRTDVKDVPPKSLQPRHAQPEATLLLRKSLEYKDKGFGTEALDNQRRAELLLQQLLEKYPESDKIGEAAYHLGDVYEKYKPSPQYERATKYFELAVLWKSTNKDANPGGPHLRPQPAAARRGQALVQGRDPPRDRRRARQRGREAGPRTERAEVTRFIALSIAAAVVTIGLKTAAYLLTESVGLLSDALESGVNLVAAVTAYVSLRIAARPADATHAYGHEKIEYFSSGLEGALIVVAGGGTVVLAVGRLAAPVPIENLTAGVLVAAAAALVNLAVGVVLIRAGRRHRSLILEADGTHLLADVWTTAAVLAGLGAAWFTGKSFFDPLLAIIVGLHVAWTGADLVARSFDGLMDHALPADEQTAIREVIRGEIPADCEFHALRTRQAASRKFADFHLLVPGATTVLAAHDLAEQVEAALRVRVVGLEVTIHLEPSEAAASWADNPLAHFEPKG